MIPVQKKITIDLSNYRSLFEHSGDGIYFSSLDGNILEVNDAFLDITGYSREEIESANSIDFYVNPNSREKFQNEILQKGSVKDFEVELYKRDKSKITCLLTSSVLKNEDNETVGFKGLIKDITILKAATSALKTSEKRFRVLFHGSPDPIFVEDLEGNILDANPAACDLHGMLYTELVGTNIFDLMPEKLREVGRKQFKELIERNISSFESHTPSIQDQKDIPIEITVSRINYLNQPALLLHVRDISKRKEAEEELIEERRRRLFEITDVQEREKKRIARELHDGIGQMLFGTKMHLESLRRKVKDNPIYLDQVQQIEQEMNNIISEVRNLSRKLRPSVLDDFGLIPALEQLLDQVKGSTNVEIIYEFHNISERVNPQVEVAIYRIVQEAINNSIRHGKSTVVWVYLEQLEDYAELLIRDNGQGFDIDDRSKMGHGLKNMHERAETMMGQFEVSSVEGRGTVIKIKIPNEYM